MSNLIIDCSNIRAGKAGGGVTHITEILNHIPDSDQPFRNVIIISGKRTLERINEKPWLIKTTHSWLDKNLFFILLWKVLKYKKILRANSGSVLFVPSGTYFGKFHPNVGMSRNMLIFDKTENSRYGISWLRLKFFILNIIQKKAFENNDLIIFISSYAKQVIQKDLKRDLSKMPIINHGINSKFIKEPKKQKPIAQYSIAEPFKLLYVSPITVYKHQWVLVKAVARLRAEGFPITLDLVGGSYAPAYKRYNQALGEIKDSSDFIHYHGVVPYVQIEGLYKQADGFIYCSTCENMPNILIEAMSSGLPICCSDYMPMPEFLGESDFYFNPTDESSIYEALKKFLLNDKLREANAGRTFELSKKYSWNTCAQKTFSELYSLVKRN